MSLCFRSRFFSNNLDWYGTLRPLRNSQDANFTEPESEIGLIATIRKGITKMRLIRTGGIATIALAVALSAQSATAQMPGVRVEAHARYDRFYSEGNHHDKIGYGGAAGVDFDLGGCILGPEVTYWRGFNENVTHDGAGVARRKSFEEWALALRAGVMVTPSTLVYAKAGYVRNE